VQQNAKSQYAKSLQPKLLSHFPATLRTGNQIQNRCYVAAASAYCHISSGLRSGFRRGEKEARLAFRKVYKAQFSRPELE
jgi:hypothetical protein